MTKKNSQDHPCDDYYISLVRRERIKLQQNATISNSSLSHSKKALNLQSIDFSKSVKVPELDKSLTKSKSNTLLGRSMVNHD